MYKHVNVLLFLLLFFVGCHNEKSNKVATRSTLPCLYITLEQSQLDSILLDRNHKAPADAVLIDANGDTLYDGPLKHFKTRGNGGVSFKLGMDQNIDLAKEIVLKYVSELSMFDCDNTNPGVVFYQGEITEEMIDYAFKAIYSIITIDEAEEFANNIGAEIHKFKKGRGIIGSIAAFMSS